MSLFKLKHIPSTLHVKGLFPCLALFTALAVPLPLPDLDLPHLVVFPESSLAQSIGGAPMEGEEVGLQLDGELGIEGVAVGGGVGGLVEGVVEGGVGALVGSEVGGVVVGLVGGGDEGVVGGEVGGIVGGESCVGRFINVNVIRKEVF